jgi:predicted nuclease of predicted toxin-antitoxin system
VKFKLDENLPVSSAAILTSGGHDVDTVTEEGLVGAPDRDVVAAATAAGRILVSLDRGLGDIRAYPPGSHAGIVVLRLTDQSATSATKAVSDLATLTDPESLAGRWRSCNADYCVSATHNQGTWPRANHIVRIGLR